MEEDKKVNEVETSILENPLNNTKIDITGDLTKMVEEVKNIDSTPVQEKNEIVEQEKEIPVIEPKSVEETVISNQNVPVETSTEVTISNVKNVSDLDNKIDTSVHDGTVITTISSEVEDKNEVEKKKLPINLVAILIVIVICIALGIFLWYFFRNEDGSYKTKYFEYLGKEENNKENNDKPIEITPSDDIVTSGDDIVTPSDEIIYTFNSGKYIFNNRTLFLNNDGTFYYIIGDDSCPVSYYGNYTVDGNMIDLTTTASYGCVECGHTSEGKLNSYVFNTRSDGRISLNREVFDYVGLEESGVTPLTCSNENAN